MSFLEVEVAGAWRWSLVSILRRVKNVCTCCPLYSLTHNCCTDVYRRVAMSRLGLPRMVSTPILGLPRMVSTPILEPPPPLMLYSPPYPPACVNKAISVVATLRPRKEVPWMARMANPGIPPVQTLSHSSPAPCDLHQPAQSVCLQCSLSRDYLYQYSCPQWPHNWMWIQGSKLDAEAWPLQRSAALLPFATA